MDERFNATEIQGVANSEKISSNVAENLYGKLQRYLKNSWQIPAAAALLISTAPGCNKNQEASTPNDAQNVELIHSANTETQMATPAPKENKNAEIVKEPNENDSKEFTKPVPEELKETARDILAVERLRLKDSKLVLGTVRESEGFVIADVGVHNTDAVITVLYSNFSDNLERVKEIDLSIIDDPDHCYDQKPEKISKEGWQSLFEFFPTGGEK